MKSTGASAARPAAEPLAATRTVSLSALVLALVAGWAVAAPPLTLVIKDQAFEPAQLTIPAGQVVKIMVRNEDALPAEFESSDFNREKVIPGRSTVPVFVGPLDPGTYGFFNDFHPQSKGKLIVVPASAPGKAKP